MAQSNFLWFVFVLGKTFKTSFPCHLSILCSLNPDYPRPCCDGGGTSDSESVWGFVCVCALHPTNNPTQLMISCRLFFTSTSICGSSLHANLSQQKVAVCAEHHRTSALLLLLGEKVKTEAER